MRSESPGNSEKLFQVVKTISTKVLCSAAALLALYT